MAYFSFKFKKSLILCLLIVFNLCSDGFTLKNYTEQENGASRRVVERGQNASLVSRNQNSTGKGETGNVLSKDDEKSDRVSKSLFLRNEVIEKNLQAIFDLLQRIENRECVRDMTYVLTGLMNNERWALQLFDALPKFPIGLLYGNMYQLGNFEECTFIKHTTDDGIQIRGQYCLADISFRLRQNNTGFVQSFQIEDKERNSRAQFNSNIIHWGICLPSSCSPNDGRILLSGVFSSLIDFKTLNVVIEDKDCYYEKYRSTSIGEIIYGSIIALFLVFILSATALHVWHIKKRKNYVSYHIYNVSSVREEKISTTKQVILSFSLIQTISKFLHVKPTELNLECICGIKFISMFFIIAGHSLIFIFGSPVANAEFADRMSVRIENSIFFNSPLLVDSFLLVSGFLMCRLFLIELEKRKGRINFAILYIARYIRLTPAYVVVIGFYVTWLPNIGDGPLWKAVTEAESLRCRQSWWTNLLYVNNYVQTDKLCMFQSWYLAADYHLFIIAPFLIYPLWKWPKTGLCLLTAVTICAIVLPGYITYLYDLDPTLLAFPPEIQDISTNFYFVNAYIKTHMRASSYFLGLIFGYAVHQMQTNCTKLPNFAVWMGWFLAGAFCLCSMTSVVLFLVPEYTHDTLQSALYAPLHRVAWASAVGWIILACVTDNAAIINKFLSWKFFVPLSRLTYCAYLVNGVILICHKGTTREAISWTKLDLLFTLLGHFVTTFLFAFILCICFESPIHGLEKILLRKKDNSVKPEQPATILRAVEANQNN